MAYAYQPDVKTEDTKTLDIYALQAFLREHPEAAHPEYFNGESALALDSAVSTSTSEVETFLRLAHLLGQLVTSYEALAASADESVKLYAESYRKAVQLDLRVAVMADRVQRQELPSPSPSPKPEPQESEPGRTLIDDVLGTSET